MVCRVKLGAADKIYSHYEEIQCFFLTHQSKIYLRQLIYIYLFNFLLAFVPLLFINSFFPKSKTKFKIMSVTIVVNIVLVTENILPNFKNLQMSLRGYSSF